MGLLQKIKESRAAQYATGALAGLGMMASAQGNNLSEQEINRQALLQSQPETYQVAQDTTELRGQERLDQLCDEYCVQEAVQQTYNILANQTSSKEVLVDDQYNIPFTQGQDQVNISDLVTIKDGAQAYLQVDTDEGTKNYNLADLTENHKISLSNGAKITREGENLVYNTSEETQPGAVSYAIHTEDDAVRLVMAHAGDSQIANQYKERLGDLIQQNDDLQNVIQLRDNKIEYLQRNLDATKQERDAERDLREETQQYLSGWGITAEGGAEANLDRLVNPKVSLGAQFPTSSTSSGNIALTYGVGGSIAGPSTTDTESETIPRGPQEGAENVRETNTTTEYALNNSIGARLQLPVNSNLKIGAEGGVKNFTATTTAEDLSYTSKDGQRFNEQRDTNTTSESMVIPYMGANASYSVTDNLDITKEVNLTFTDDIDVSPVSTGIGVRYTIQ